MGSSREVVTLQFGHYSNFIGAHWWNLQESSFIYDPSQAKEIDHDVLWREGKNANGDVTYTPRLVGFDLRGSLGALRQEGTLYEVTEGAENIPWLSDVTLHKSAPAPKNKFLRDLEEADKDEDVDSEPDKEKCVVTQDVIERRGSAEIVEPVYRTKLYDLDESVKVWSDCLRVHLHPRSMHIVTDYDHDDAEYRPFNVFGYGNMVYKEYTTRSEIEDRLHFFLEECDHLQGLQILVDGYDGFGGLGSSVLEDLIDDYGSKTLVAIPVAPSVFERNLIKDQCHRAVNTALTTDAMLSHCTSVLPLSVPTEVNFPHLQYNPALQYHTSAILAASIESATAAYRLDKNPAPMSSMFGALSESGRKILGLQSSFPLPIRTGQSLVGALLESGSDPIWSSLTPSYKPGSTPWSQSVHVRGLPLARLHPLDSVTKPVTNPANERLQQCTTIPEVLELYLREVTGSRLNHVTALDSPLTLHPPFPHVFSPHVTTAGELGAGRTDPRTGSGSSGSDRTGMALKSSQSFNPTGNTLTATGSTSHNHNNPNPASGDRTVGVGVSVSRAPVLTALQAGAEVQQHLRRAVLDPVRRFNIKKFHKFRDAGLEEDDYKEAIARLESVHDLYLES